jgi:hypothetical protein
VRLSERLTRSGSLALVRTGGVRSIDGVGGDGMVGCRSLWRDNVGCDVSGPNPSCIKLSSYGLKLTIIERHLKPRYSTS